MWQNDFFLLHVPGAPFKKKQQDDNTVVRGTKYKGTNNIYKIPFIYKN